VKLDVKGAIAILVVVGSFTIIGVPYIAFNRTPDPVVLIFATGALMLVLGFYFGHINGTQTALTSNAVALTNNIIPLVQQALEKRAATTVPVVATVPLASGPPTAAAG